MICVVTSSEGHTRVSTLLLSIKHHDKPEMAPRYYGLDTERDSNGNVAVVSLALCVSHEFGMQIFKAADKTLRKDVDADEKGTEKKCTLIWARPSTLQLRELLGLAAHFSSMKMVATGVEIATDLRFLATGQGTGTNVSAVDISCSILPLHCDLHDMHQTAYQCLHVHKLGLARLHGAWMGGPALDKKYQAAHNWSSDKQTFSHAQLLYAGLDALSSLNIALAIANRIAVNSAQTASSSQFQSPLHARVVVDLRLAREDEKRANACQCPFAYDESRLQEEMQMWWSQFGRDWLRRHWSHIIARVILNSSGPSGIKEDENKLVQQIEALGAPVFVSTQPQAEDAKNQVATAWQKLQARCGNVLNLHKLWHDLQARYAKFVLETASFFRNKCVGHGPLALTIAHLFSKWPS